MAATAQVHLAQLIMIVRDYACSTDIAALRGALAHMVDRPVFDHQLVRAMRTVAPYLTERFPWLLDIDVPRSGSLAEPQVRQWLAEQVLRHGAWHDVPRMPEGVWADLDPIAELARSVPVIGVIADTPGSRSATGSDGSLR